MESTSHHEVQFSQNPRFSTNWITEFIFFYTKVQTFKDAEVQLFNGNHGKSDALSYSSIQ